MIISDTELEAFANFPRNKIALGKCDRNTYKFYNSYWSQGALIYYGKADYFRNGEFISNVDHYWNAIRAVTASGEELFQVVDIYNYKSSTNDEYRNHAGKNESFNSLKDWLSSSIRLTRASNGKNSVGCFHSVQHFSQHNFSA